MVTPFHDFDFSHFWNDTPCARQEYISPPPSDELIHSLEEELGYQLPASYLHLMRMHNGGAPHLNCFPMEQPYTKRSDYLMISGIYGIGREKPYSLGGAFGSRFKIEEWGYPEIGVVIGSCPSAGHDLIMLDYRTGGPQSEPAVVHVDQEVDYQITLLAPDFVEDWLNMRLEERLFRKSLWRGWSFTKTFEQDLLRRLKPYTEK